MATENRQMQTTIEAKEDLNAHQYCAVALNDGKIANNAEESSGILQNKPKNTEFAHLVYSGESKYKAGLAISAGAKLTVATSGYFTTADSNDAVVGEAKLAVTSGSTGTGLFSFPNATDKATGIPYEVTPLVNLIAGTVIAFDDMLQADNGEESDGVTENAMTSGTPADVIVHGLVQGRMDPAECSSASDALTVTASGYFSLGDSGDYIVAKALASVGSNTQGDIFFLGIGGYLSV